MAQPSAIAQVTEERHNHHQCSAFDPTALELCASSGTGRTLVCGCPHARAVGCGHKFGSGNPPPCAFHVTAIAVARAQRNRCATVSGVMGMTLGAQACASWSSVYFTL